MKCKACRLFIGGQVGKKTKKNEKKNEKKFEKKIEKNEQDDDRVAINLSTFDIILIGVIFVFSKIMLKI